MFCGLGSLPTLQLQGCDSTSLRLFGPNAVSVINSRHCDLFAISAGHACDFEIEFADD